MHKFPGMRWDAEGNAHLCRSETDVQPGWTDQHPSNIPAKVVVSPSEAAILTQPEMTRAEIVSALIEGGISFSKNAPTAALYKQLVAAAKDVLTAAEIAFDPEADARTLLNLLPKPE